MPREGGLRAGNPLKKDWDSNESQPSDEGIHSIKARQDRPRETNQGLTNTSFTHLIIIG